MELLELIALFLNVATHRLAAENYNLRFLLGRDKLLTGCSFDVGQETQCLAFDGTLWIANNDDDDTATQRKMLDALGVSSPDLLWDLAYNYGQRAFRWVKEKAQPKSPKEKALSFILGERELGDPYEPAGTVANPTFRLSSHAVPPVSCIGFVTGDYVGIDGDSQPVHAEQKLLAALGLLVQRAGMPHGVINVGGCKAPCRVCNAALKAVADLGIFLRLSYDSRPAVVTARKKAGIGIETSGATRHLDVGHYFG